MIELYEIGKTYTRPTRETVRVLCDVTLRIRRGEFVAIIGASGSGKSTLMNVLGLLDIPTTGRYQFDGRNVPSLQRRSVIVTDGRRVLGARSFQKQFEDDVHEIWESMPPDLPVLALGDRVVRQLTAAL